MKKVIAILVVAVSFSFSAQAQDVMKKDEMKKEKTMVKDEMKKEKEMVKAKTISLEQTPGEFTQKNLTLKEGTYIFEVTNKNAGKDVGFVIVPKGEDASNPKNHIQNAYVTQVVKEGTKETSKEVALTKGEYIYFCPMNKTPQYTLTVE